MTSALYYITIQLYACDVSTQKLCSCFIYKYYYHVYDTDLCDGNIGIKLEIFKAAGEVIEQQNCCKFYRMLDCAIS